MRQRFIESAGCCAALLLLASASAQAQKAPTAKAPAQASVKPSKAKESPAAAKNRMAIANAQGLMGSSDRDTVEAGIQSLGLLGTADAVEPLAERIRQGLPPELLETAIVTLMALGQPKAGPVLYELTAHRRPDIRLRAVEAIAATNPPGAEDALSAALSDSDPRVRAAAATGLGEVGSASSLEKLFLALDRGNMEASGAIGRVMPPAQVKRLTGYLGQIPFRSLGPALAQVLRRSDVSESQKLELIARLQEVGTREVKGYLGDLIAAGAEGLSSNLSRAMLRAMQEIAESP
jgi:HEAT repeat protein